MLVQLLDNQTDACSRYSVAADIEVEVMSEEAK